MNPVLHLKKNTKGRDIVVGDIHGSFALLKMGLKAINFDPSRDRLLSLGDLVDRGRHSVAFLPWVKKPWFFSVMGNHDAQYAFYGDDELFGDKSLVCIPSSPWYVDLPNEKMLECFGALRRYLRPAIEVETEVGLVGLVHAEVPFGLDWPTFTERLNQKDYELFHDSFWGRETAKQAGYQQLPEYYDRVYKNLSDIAEVKGIQHVFHGHSIGKELNYAPYSLGNRYFIDTGAYKLANKTDHPNASMTFYDVRDPRTPLYQMTAQTLRDRIHSHEGNELTA